MKTIDRRVMVDDLVVGKIYKIPSGLGGVFTIEYLGREWDNPTSKHRQYLYKFSEPTNEGWQSIGPYNLTADRVLDLVMEVRNE